MPLAHLRDISKRPCIVSYGPSHGIGRCRPWRSCRPGVQRFQASVTIASPMASRVVGLFMPTLMKPIEMSLAWAEAADNCNMAIGTMRKAAMPPADQRWPRSSAPLGHIAYDRRY